MGRGECTEGPLGFTGTLWFVTSDMGLKAYAARVDARLQQLLPAPDVPPFSLHEAMRYSALAPGKRLRPALCMEACAACGGSPDDALDAGCAIELVHCFSLIHDDLPAIDNDDLRRGRPTLHRAFDEGTAILAGDALFALAFRVAASVSAEVAGELAEASGALVRGEVLDILGERSEPNRAMLESIHLQKTAALVAASCAIGARVAGARDEHIEALRRYGTALGLAFQIADDLLDETATSEQMGKDVRSDRERQKMTYPALMGLDASREEAYRQSAAAVAELDVLPGDTQLLRELAEFTVTRSR